MRKFIINALKGFGMGAANVVPGVSGGTIAILTGIYTDIVNSLDAFTAPQTWKALLSGKFREFWKGINGNFLLALGVGIIVSVFSLAKLMTLAIGNYPILTWAFFFGLILASAAIMFTDVKKWSLTDVLMVVAGAVIAVVVCTLSPTETPDTPLMLFLSGAIAICTMILPGVSGSFVLLIMGKYNDIMEAISTMNIPVLAYFGIGCVVGILAFAKLLHWLLQRWEKPTMLFLLGFVLGSLVKVWPWNDMSLVTDGNLQIPGAIICCIAGIALVAGLNYLGKKNNR
ncbi:MAG: DUF368 domain-containing protein [Bacteroidales bacterium]|nr:DUF368 domain-containing protein [Candidatus Cryptobacteroides equifaecalis]